MGKGDGNKKDGFGCWLLAFGQELKTKTTEDAEAAEDISYLGVLCVLGGFNCLAKS